MTETPKCPDCSCRVEDRERFVGPHSWQCGWWDGRATEAAAYARTLGENAPPVQGFPPCTFIVFTRAHGEWSDVSGFGYPTVIDGGTVSTEWTNAQLFAKGHVGIRVALLSDHLLLEQDDEGTRR